MYRYEDVLLLLRTNFFPSLLKTKSKEQCQMDRSSGSKIPKAECISFFSERIRRVGGNT